jgi:16S rRNA (guanine527-N7)-methyltransferase
MFHVKQQPLDATAFQALTGLTDAVVERLAAYVALLEKWNPRINLVSPNSLADVWRRHILDCAQLYALLPPGVGRVVDLGSGAGLPGLVLAILGVADTHLIEADLRKATFLAEAARITDTAVTIHRLRIEAAPALAADIVTARALAPLTQLLDYANPLLRPGGSCYFLKGSRVADELTEARKSWHMNIYEHASRSDPGGVILQVEAIARERHD